MVTHGKNLSYPQCNWLLLRGLARESRHWGEFPNLLQNQFPESQIACFDKAGNGLKNKMNSFLTIAEYAEEFHLEFQSLKKLNNNPWKIVGISMGGMVALEWVARYPTDFDQAFIVSSSASNLSPVFHRLQLSALKYMLLAGISRGNVAKEMQVLKMVSHLHKTDKVLAQEWAGYANSHPTHLNNVAKQLFASSQFKAPKKISLPLEFVVGDQDAMVSPQCSHDLAKYYKVPCHVIENAGHEVALDQPQRLIQVFEGSLKS